MFRTQTVLRWKWVSIVLPSSHLTSSHSHYFSFSSYSSFFSCNKPKKQRKQGGETQLDLPLARCKFVISEKVLRGCRRLISHQDASNLGEQNVTNNHRASLWSLAPVRSSREGGASLSLRCSHLRGTGASGGFLKADGNDRKMAVRLQLTSTQTGGGEEWWRRWRIRRGISSHHFRHTGWSKIWVTVCVRTSHTGFRPSFVWTVKEVIF